jgi:ketosteroid isomerase-like protein
VASTYEVGQRLVQFCNENRNVDAVNELYAPNVVSQEVAGHPGVPARVEGIDDVRKKNQWWLDNHTIHSNRIDGPYPHGDRFIVHFAYDVTSKAGPMAGKRMQVSEAGLYTVRDGKVVHEEFFYHMG